MIVNVPIESLEERYSSDWNVWFPEEFRRLGVEFYTVYSDELVDKITEGSFLDVCGTNYFKAGQLKLLCRDIFKGRIKDRDVLFFHDIWFPGLEMLQYIRQGKGVEFRIVGILHAGTYDPYDFLSQKGMGAWGELIENGWFVFIDKLFVATEFHRQMILSTRKVDSSKILVTGLPIYPVPMQERKKEKIVVFPHRLDLEKNPNEFDALAERFRGSGWRFVKTKEVCKNKKEYYRLLSKSRIAVSFAEQETWGIAQQEALFLGCVPLVPNRLSYVEMYEEEFRYDTFEDCVQKLERFLKGDVPYEKVEKNKQVLMEKGKKAIGKMVTEMLSL